jgi:hypothetical protein
VTIEYAVKVHPAHPYFEVPEEDEYLKISIDPAVSYRRQQAFPAGAASLVHRRNGGDWEPVNGIDQYCIALRAAHEIISRTALVEGFGWARCTCGWKSQDASGSGFAHPDYEELADQHIANIAAAAQQFRNRMVYVPRDPDQEACPHKHDETREHFNNPGLRDWRCKDCGLHMQYIADFETWVR